MTTSLAMVTSLVGAAAVGVLALGVAGASPAAAATPGPFTVNIANREDVRDFYNDVYLPASNVPDGWTGNVATCNPGTLSQAFLDATLSRINYFRTMAGDPDVTFTAANNAEAQAAALIQGATTGNLNHNPQPGSTCWTQLGQDGSGAANLFAGREGPAAISANTRDPNGNGSDALGHRRNMLDPSITTMGEGSVPSSANGRSAEASLVITPPLATRPTVRDGFVAWPPPGFVPYQTVFPAWSFSLPNADFSAASVSVTHNGAAFPVTIRCVDPNVTNNSRCGQFGDPAISWNPTGVTDGADWPQPTADDPYNVTISNVMVNGVAQAPINYTVTVIDPSVADAAHSVAQPPQGPTIAPVNSNPSYTVLPVTDATGYQLRASSLSPGDVVDGAENGLTNWTPVVSPAYNPISTREQSTGASSFRLAGFGSAASPDQQTLTFNKLLLANAQSSLSFDSLFTGLLNLSAQVDVSLDGTNWRPIFQQAPPSTQQDSTFTNQTVSLGQFAGRILQLRFSLTFTGGNWSVGCCGEPIGWYFDNVALSNVQDANNPTLSAVSVNPTGVFTNPQQGPFAVDMRPQFTNPTFGNSFGPWSQVANVTSSGGTGFTTLTSSANPSSAGQTVTYTASVAPTDGGGTVSFSVNGSAIAGCTSLPLAGGQATCDQQYTLNFPTSIVATYSGDAAFLGSSSAPLTQVIQAPSGITGSLTTSASNVNGGDPVTFTATVTPVGGATFDGGGTVSFTDNNATITGCGAVPLTAAGTAICPFSSPGPEHSVIEAVYSGDANFSGGLLGDILEAVTASTTSTLTSSANPAAVGQSVTYTATVSPANQGGSFAFLTDSGNGLPGCVVVQPDATGVATCTTTFPSTGAHPIRASFTSFGGLNFWAPSVSPVVHQEVGTLAATSTSLVSSANPAVTGQQVTYTATVSPAGGAGTVTFTDDGFDILGCQNLTPSAGGLATCAQTYSTASTHPVLAYYSGDTGNAGSTSAPVNQVVAVAPPGAVPGAAIANLGNRSAAVAFTAPTTKSVTGFNVFQGTSPGHESTTPINPSRLLSTAKGYMIKGLTAGTTYYYKVKAINAGGAGPASPEVSTRAATVPSAPQTLAAHPAASSVALTWVAPASNGGSPVTSYNVFSGPAPGKESVTPVNAAPIAATATGYTVTKLVTGQKYYFTVRATNAVAASVASNEVATTPLSVPLPPVNTLAYPGQASAGIRWVAPVDNGGSPITGFNVYKGTTSGGESATPVNPTPLPRTATNYRVTGLVNGTKYFFNVKAISAVGASLASTQSSATPTAAATAPIWPGTVVAKPAVSSVKLTWVAPVATGGSAITGYFVYLGTAPGKEAATPVNVTKLPVGTLTYTATGLSSSKTYYFQVRAVNAIGFSAPSNEATARPYGPATAPGAPGKLKGVAGSAKASLTWVAPSFNGGSAVTGYNVYKGTTAGGESATPLNATPLTAATLSFTVTGLAHNTLYFFSVRAINAAGKSAPSEVSVRAI